MGGGGGHILSIPPSPPLVISAVSSGVGVVAKEEGGRE